MHRYYPKSAICTRKYFLWFACLFLSGGIELGDGGEGLVDLEGLSTDAGHAKALETRRVHRAVLLGGGSCSEEINTARLARRSALGPNLPQEAVLGGDALGEALEGDGHVGAERTGGGEVNLKNEGHYGCGFALTFFVF